MNNPFSSDKALDIGQLNICSVGNKVVYTAELLNEFHLGPPCITETWLSESDTGTIEPNTRVLLHVPRSSWMNGRGRGCCNLPFGFIQHQIITS